MIGSDFTLFQSKEYEVLDQFIRYLNMISNETGISVKYSTFQAYAEAIYKEGKEKGIQFPEKTNDFFPYADTYTTTDFWTGFFTSNPDFKHLIR